ncbi:dystroglycan 1-like, partial [Lampetra planeri]
QQEESGGGGGGRRGSPPARRDSRRSRRSRAARTRLLAARPQRPQRPQNLRRFPPRCDGVGDSRPRAVSVTHRAMARPLALLVALVALGLDEAGAGAGTGNAEEPSRPGELLLARAGPDSFPEPSLRALDWRPEWQSQEPPPRAEPRGPGGPGGPGAVAGAVPDLSTSAGQGFELHLPTLLEGNASVQVYQVGSDALPRWLHWDPRAGRLLGHPLEADTGVYHISIGHDASPGQVFSIAVLPEESSAGARPPAPFSNSIAPAAACEPGQPHTVLTVVIDADVDTLALARRTRLLDGMTAFSGVAMHDMRLLPVRNNKLFDMSAFVAGPGNAKKMVENGATLSWLLGCGLGEASVPSLAAVEKPAKEGAMATALGFPVLGWYVANQKPPAGKRVRRGAPHVTPTPVMTSAPPTRHPQPEEPPARVVPSQPSHSPLPTTRTAWPDRFAAGGAATAPLPVKPTATLPGTAEPTLVPAPPAVPDVSRKTEAATAPSARRATTTAATAAAAATRKPPRSKRPRVQKPDEAVPRPAANQVPYLQNPVDRLDVNAGTYFEYKIPVDTFYDAEDGPTDKLKLSLSSHVDHSAWVQLNSASRVLFGLPPDDEIAKHEFFLTATDKGGKFVSDAFEIVVRDKPNGGKSSVKFEATFANDYDAVSKSLFLKVKLMKKLAQAFGEKNASVLTLEGLRHGSLVVTWSNGSLPAEPCPLAEVRQLYGKMHAGDGRPRDEFRAAMLPEFEAVAVGIKGTDGCRGANFLSTAPWEPAVPRATEPPTQTEPRSSSQDDAYLHTVIPAVAVALLLLIAGVVAFVCYRRKRRGKMSLEEHTTFIKKGVPIIFADELDEAKPAPSSSMPLILTEERAPLSPPEYSGQTFPGGLPEELRPLRDDGGGGSVPPYQPPPPFASVEESRRCHPKSVHPVKSLPTYVPP